MNGYLVDTNILSELTKPTPAPLVGLLRRLYFSRILL